MTRLREWWVEWRRRRWERRNPFDGPIREIPAGYVMAPYAWVWIEANGHGECWRFEPGVGHQGAGAGVPIGATRVYTLQPARLPPSHG